MSPGRSRLWMWQRKQNWTVVSIKNDWNTVFADAT